MAGYSGTPLAQKLGIKDGHTVALFGAPSGFERTLDGLPAGVRFTTAPARGSADVALLFAKSRADFRRGFAKAAACISPAGGLWVAWPKKASGIATDMTENTVRDVGLPTGLVDNKVCAIDEVWSGLRLVYRLENRSSAAKSAARARRVKTGERSPARTRAART